MDRISGLPKAILHDILGRLPDKDAAKTCVLSKLWRETWFSFPILSICSKNFFTRRDFLSSPEDPLWLSKLDTFTEYVTKRLMRLRDQHLTIKEVKLNLTYIIVRRQVNHYIDWWIQMAIESGVEVLELHLTGGAKGDWYNIPLCLTQAKSLTKLVLSGGIRLDPAFLNHSLKFFSMKTLSLSHLLFGYEGVMEHFISHCPLIEHLTLDFCNVDNPLRLGDPPGSNNYRVKSLSLHGLQNLKGASLQYIREVHIGAPNLENLIYYAPVDGDESFMLNLDSCTNLKCLSLWHLRSPNKLLHEILSKIPFLESLTLRNCSIFEYEKLNISSPQLKFFGLLFCSNLKEVNIDAPNLLSCDYGGDDKLAISSLRNSNQPELNAYLGVDPRHPYSLREFVENIKPQEVLGSLSLFIHEPCSFRESLGVLQVSSLPPSIKRVQLRVHMDKEADYFPFMNWLLSSCFPETISFSLRSFFNMKAFIVVVKVTHLERTYENVEDLKAMLDALPESHVAEYVNFGLEL
ncbi:hypothetical protein PIB30_012204 [Stylosanthes scabra]|uniref:F-box domain-containing protein n=1 Tax=Stylosanthes scabra TaxID=79078 RepID=A0ABU6U530_9FABA|nr:hypothetical protein [Stylosanthes scabra]